MEQKTYIVEGRQFRTESDYNRAVRDRDTIVRLRGQTDMKNRQELERLRHDLEHKKYHFYTLLGEDFLDEVRESIEKAGKVEKSRGRGRKTSAGTGAARKTGGGKTAGSGAERKAKKNSGQEVKADKELAPIVEEELKRREKRRRMTVLLCSAAAVVCLGYFSIYTYYDYKTGRNNELLSELKSKPPVAQGGNEAPVIHYTKDTREAPPVLDEYKNLVNKNKKVIGWVKIDDTNIDYPVMQTGDNEYYLDHNLNQEYDKNGSIFMDKDCDVLKPSTNFILYGHHMKSGKMFGKLDLYVSEDYYKEHPTIQFDTIYEKGVYEIMYVFRSRIYSEEDIVFKYYQFIDALSEQEFDSYMEEMAKLSYYDTGVTASFGDQLLTLSTCDYEVRDGRFVVVARKVSE